MAASALGSGKAGNAQFFELLRSALGSYFRGIITNNGYLLVSILERNLMTDPDVRFNQMIAALKEHNFRLTPQRVELVRLIAASEGHPSANQFYEKIKLNFPTMSHATVYKTLALLKEMDQVLEINLREDSHYDGNRPQPHPHLICMKCNKIVDGEISLDQELISKLEKGSGYTILRPQISLYGLCPDCKKEG